MRFKSVLLSASVAATSAIAARLCGTSDPTDDQLAAASQFKEIESSVSTFRTWDRRIAINVYFHVVANAPTVKGGYLSNTTIGQQLEAMNTAFAPHDISFNLAGVDWTINSTWSSNKAAMTMKKALRKGSYSDLNLYFITSATFFGNSTIPQQVTPESDAFYDDSCTVLASSVPGGALTNYNLGYTAVHEAGHWLGLFHTFGDHDCNGDGDFVDDTPAEVDSADGCPVGRDTCASAGVDPIHNYMDYTYDTCYEEFTAGQVTRMRTSWDAYRAP